MKSNWQTRVLTSALAAALAVTGVTPVYAGAAPDGNTKAVDLASKMGADELWSNWQEEWNSSKKSDWTQISLTPGSNASELNFAWYSKKPIATVTDGEITQTAAPKLKIGEGRSMRNAKIYTAVQTDVKDETDADGNTYYSNKVTATDLKENTTYYYCYEKDGSYTEPVAYTTKATNNFSFIFVGDPQIGSSNEEKGKDTPTFYNAQSEAVCSDSFNWEMTLNAAMDMSGNQASFVVSAGDQIQTRLKKSPGETNKNAKSEVEYSGYLSPDILKSLPVATTVGNHDADNPNYTYHFNTPNTDTLGSTKAGGDYYFTYGPVLFLMLNTQNANIAEHKQFIEKVVAANSDCKWKVVTLHQDIYGSAEHSNEPEITNLRYQLVPIFEDNDIDVVLTGHDHAYSRTKMLLGGTQSEIAKSYTDDEFGDELDKDVDVTDGATRYVAPENIKVDSTDEADQKYLAYLNSIMDASAVEQVKTESDAVVNPDGILYMTANSASGSKYYDLVPRMQTYIAGRWQEDVPTYSIVNVTESSFSISTYRTDNNEKIDESFTIAKVTVDKKQLQVQISEAEALKQADYTTDSYAVLQTAIAGAKKVADDSKATNSEVESAIRALAAAKTALVKKADEGNKESGETGTAKISLRNADVKKLKNVAYSGKSIKPSVTVTVNGKTLKKNQDYTVTYSNNKKIGKATVKITGQGNYTGSKSVTFYITPEKVKVKSVKSLTAKKATVKLEKAAGSVSGYQVVYSTNSKFKGAKSKTTAKTALTLASLSSKKTYYVKVRAYKKVSGKKIYGEYSKTMRVKVK